MALEIRPRHYPKAAHARSRPKTISQRQVTASDRSRAVLDPPTSEGERAHDVERVQKSTVGCLGCVGKTDVGQVSEINGGITNKMDRGLAADVKNLKPIETH